MEPVFVAVTIIALALAVGMSVLGWKLLHDDRARSSARVDALRALGAGLEPDMDDSGSIPAPAVTSPARFSIIEEPDDADAWDGRFGPPAPAETPAPPVPARTTAEFTPPRPIHIFEAPEASVADDLFATASVQPRGRGRRWLVLAAVASVMVGAAATIYAIPRFHWATRTADVSTPADAARAQPLELLSLRNSSDADGTFVVTGLVGNPAASLPLRGLVAVVYLFDREGNYFAGSRSPIDLAALQPGDESPFVVRIPAAAGVARYRVGFRLTDGAVVAHVDRRGQPVEGLTEDTMVPGAPPPAATATPETATPPAQTVAPVPASTGVRSPAPVTRTRAIRGSGQ